MRQPLASSGASGSGLMSPLRHQQHPGHDAIRRRSLRELWRAWAGARRRALARRREHGGGQAEFRL